MSTPFRWGIVGAGGIARKFAAALQVVPDATLAAIGSRDIRRARAFADANGAERSFGNYETLAADPDIDAVYVATRHTAHRDVTCLCLEHSKPVLCEKPFAVNAGEAGDMILVSRANGVFLMEAMWTRFLPVTRQVCRWVEGGAIGQARTLCADFGFKGNRDPAGRLFNPGFGGGSLLDIGVYTLAYATMLFGAPVEIKGTAHIGATGVDEQAAFVLRYGGGQIAVLACSIEASTSHRVAIWGTEGRIELDRFWCATEATLVRPGHEPETVTQPHRANGFEYQIEEVQRCLQAGLSETPLLPLAESLLVMETADVLREQWGLVYPQERVV